MDEELKLQELEMDEEFDEKDSTTLDEEELDFLDD